MNETWGWLVAAAAWVFLAGTMMIALSGVPRLARRHPRLLLNGFLVTLLSFVLVFLAWGLPRLF